MEAELTAAPVLSTPAEHLFEHAATEVPPVGTQIPRRTDDELREVFEIARTAADLRAARRRRVALQFPDSMLGDAPHVVQLLNDELAALRSGAEEDEEKIYILADTSYSACCVDEIAAQHVDADVVVHYGRSCLSPTSRLPVIYVFTRHPLDADLAVEAFEKEFPERGAKAVIMADVTYQDHVPEVFARLRGRGYGHVLSTKVVRNPVGSIPNRSIVDAGDREVSAGDAGAVDLASYSIFHISTPPTSLLLSLSSKFRSFHTFDPTQPAHSQASPAPSARAMLGRRYAKVLTLATAGIVGILINTLSVSNYMSSVDAIRARIATAGKKSYTVVVGKLNPAKLANFAEVDGWVAVGCWESGLVEDDAGFYRPVVTPFELEVALMPDEERVWGDRWWGGIEGVTMPDVRTKQQTKAGVPGPEVPLEEPDSSGGLEDEESAPPVFDLRTGRLVSHSRPMQPASNYTHENGPSGQQQGLRPPDALALRPKSELATVKGAVSPGAEFLRSQRTWQGLGSDFDAAERSAAIEEGRSGVARGYAVGGDDTERR